ncbi:MAG: serine hydrolase, partial [Salibacteraceae bacterium]
LWSLDHEGGIEKAFCCINATARDFARIGKLVLNDGIWNNESIVNKSFVREAVRPNGLNNKDGTPCITYGLSWWLGEYEGKSFYFMRGIKGQYVIVLPELDLILVRMGKKRDVGSGNPHPDDVYRYIEMALRISEQ